MIKLGVTAAVHKGALAFENQHFWNICVQSSCQTPWKLRSATYPIIFLHSVLLLKALPVLNTFA